MADFPHDEDDRSVLSGSELVRDVFSNLDCATFRPEFSVEDDVAENARLVHHLSSFAVVTQCVYLASTVKQCLAYRSRQSQAADGEGRSEYEGERGGSGSGNGGTTESKLRWSTFTIGVVGAGRIGCAVLDYILKSDLSNDTVIVSTRQPEAVFETYRSHSNIKISFSNAKVAAKCDVIILAVSPSNIRCVSESMRAAIAARESGPVIISVVVGVPPLRLQNLLCAGSNTVACFALSADYGYLRRFCRPEKQAVLNVGDFCWENWEAAIPLDDAHATLGNPIWQRHLLWVAQAFYVLVTWCNQVLGWDSDMSYRAVSDTLLGNEKMVRPGPDRDAFSVALDVGSLAGAGGFDLLVKVRRDLQRVARLTILG